MKMTMISGNGENDLFGEPKRGDLHACLLICTLMLYSVVLSWCVQDHQVTQSNPKGASYTRVY